MTKPHRIVGIDFSHMHMGDLLRMVLAHPRAEIVGLWHSEPRKPAEVVGRLGLDADLIFADWRQCLETTRPTAAILCAATGEHGLWAQRLAEYDVDVLVEKPMAASLDDADAMIDAMQAAGRRLAINWPMAWYPCHRTLKRLIDEGRIGEVVNLHYYDGNRGPAHHKMDKIEVTGAELLREKQQSWFYRRAAGGGSLLDYLGYGVTLGAWFDGGRLPLEVTAVVDQPPGLEVDEHSITIARYASGLSKFETRWGTFTDPWTHQPQPKCGFVVCGSQGTISSYDGESSLRIQTTERPEGYDVPAESLKPPVSGPIEYFLDCVERDAPIAGPLSPATSRVGQQIVDAALESARLQRTVALAHSPA